MYKLFSCLLIVLALLFAPFVQANAMHCQGKHCKVSEQTQKYSQDNADSSKGSQDEAKCCSVHAYVASVDDTISDVDYFSVKKFVSIADNRFASFVTAPLLEPPLYL